MYFIFRYKITVYLSWSSPTCLGMSRSVPFLQAIVRCVGYTGYLKEVYTLEFSFPSVAERMMRSILQLNFGSSTLKAVFCVISNFLRSVTWSQNPLKFWRPKGRGRGLMIVVDRTLCFKPPCRFCIHGRFYTFIFMMIIFFLM